MSDDFDKHDDDFDWLSDDGDEKSPDSSGLTGELSWMQDAESSPDAGKKGDADDLELDWLQSGGSYETRDVKGDATGVTGELSWLGDADMESSPDAPSKGVTDALDWMKEAEEEPASQTDTNINDIPDWLKAADAADDNYEDDQPEQPQSFGFTGMFDDMADEDDASMESNETPQWLSNMGETGALSEDIDEHPDWLQHVGDTGTLNRDKINEQLSSMSDDDDEEQPGWLSDMGIGQSSTDDFDSDDDALAPDAPDWLSGLAPEVADEPDDEDEYPDMDSLFGFSDDAYNGEPEATGEPDDEDEYPDMDSLFGFSDDAYDEELEPAEGDGSTDWLKQYDDDAEYGTGALSEQPSQQLTEDADDEEEVANDTGWLDYDDGDTDDDYDPYAHYDDLDDDDEEYDEVFQTGELAADTGTLTSKSDLFDTDQPVSDMSFEDDTPDWLSSYGDEDFGTDDEPVEEQTDALSQNDWLNQFGGDESFEDIGTGELAPDPINDVPDWLKATNETVSESDEIADIPEMETDDFMASLDDEMDVPDWLKATDDTISESDEIVDIPEMETDDFMADFRDELDVPSTGLTGDLDAIDDEFDFGDLDSTGLTGELADLDAIGADLLADLDIGDLGDLDDIGEIDVDDLDFDLDDLGTTGLMGELADFDDDSLRVGTGFTGELESADDDLDLSFLEDVEVDDEPDRVGTGFTGELESADDDLDLSFLEDVEVDDEPDRVGTGFTGELESADDDLDLSFLEDVEVEDEPDRVGTGFTGELESADDEMDLSFLDEIDEDEGQFDTGQTDDLDAEDEELDLSFLDDAEDEELDLSFLEEEEDEEPDWFDEPTEVVEEGEPEWMRTLDEVNVDAFLDDADEGDLEDLFGEESQVGAVFESDRKRVPEADLNSLLATFDDVEDSDFAEDDGVSNIDDLDAIFDAALRQDDVEDELPDHIPEWLREADISSDEGSAAAIIRQQSDKPIEELDERLQALRDRALSVSSESAEATPSPDLTVLKGVPETLATPHLEHETASIVSDIQLTGDQQSQADLLQKIVGVTITPTVETDEEGTPIVRSSRRRRRALPNVGLGRLLVATLLLLVLVLPFVSNFGVGGLPPVAFGGDNQNANVVFNELQALNEGDWVLVGMEYGPTGAGELDTVTDILLRHIFSQGAKPIIVSSNPVAIVHAQNILNDIQIAVSPSGLELQSNRDYYILRYLSGGLLGLRDLSQNFDSVVAIDARGNPTRLDFASLDDMALMIVIAERSDDIRSWAEQVAPSTRTKLLAATGYAARPLAEPYVNQTDGIAGLIVGYRDAFTYGEMLQGVFATATPLPSDTPTLVPTETNTPLPTETPAPTNTPEPTSEGDNQSAETPLAVDGATDGDSTTVSTDTPVPTETPLPSDTPTATASNTPEPTSTPTATATPNLISVIVIREGNGSVNVRTGPSTNDSVLTTANAGSVFQVIDRNADGTWIHFLLPDGRDGWIATFLVDEIELPEDEFQNSETDDSADVGGTGVVVLRLDFNRRMGKNGARVMQQSPTETLEATLTPSITPSPTMTPTATMTPSPTPDPRGAYAFARDRQQEVSRLNAMTLGTIAAVVIIILGNIYFGLRAMAQRRRESKR